MVVGTEHLLIGLLQGRDQEWPPGTGGKQVEEDRVIELVRPTYRPQPNGTDRGQDAYTPRPAVS